MSSIIEITPILRDYNGTPVKFGPVRYLVPEEVTQAQLREQYSSAWTPQPLQGFNSFQTVFLSFEVRVLDAKLPQPELAPAVIVKVEEAPQRTVTVDSAGITPGPQRIGTLASLLLESLYDKAEELDP